MYILQFIQNEIYRRDNKILTINSNIDLLDLIIKISNDYLLLNIKNKINIYAVINWLNNNKYKLEINENVDQEILQIKKNE